MRCVECNPSFLAHVDSEFDNFFEFADHVMSHDKHELKNWAADVIDSENYVNYRMNYNE